MKQSEKDELISRAKKFSTVMSFRGSAISEPVIEVSKLETMINSLPTEPDEVKEVYAIKDLTTNEMIWNAHGCPYKSKDDVEKKIKKLRCLFQNKDKIYQIVTYKRED